MSKEFAEGLAELCSGAPQGVMEEQLVSLMDQLTQAFSLALSEMVENFLLQVSFLKKSEYVLTKAEVSKESRRQLARQTA